MCYAICQPPYTESHGCDRVARVEDPDLDRSAACALPQSLTDFSGIRSGGRVIIRIAPDGARNLRAATNAFANCNRCLSD